MTRLGLCLNCTLYLLRALRLGVGTDYIRAPHIKLFLLRPSTAWSCRLRAPAGDGDVVVVETLPLVSVPEVLEPRESQNQLITAEVIAVAQACNTPHGG